jgi:hypothetical protein
VWHLNNSDIDDLAAIAVSWATIGEYRRYITVSPGRAVRSVAMSTLALIVAIILAIATATFYVAGSVYGHGAPWAVDVCHTAGAFCQNPEWTAVATAVTATAYFWLRRGEA